MKRILPLLLTLLLLLPTLSACGASEEAAAAPMAHPVNFYYRTVKTDFTAEDGVIRAELRDLNPGLSLKELFEIYFEGPEQDDLTKPFSNDCSLDNAYRSGDRLELRLTRSAFSPAAFDHTLTYACLARTGLDLDGITAVHIYVKTPGGAKADEITLTESSLLLYDKGLAQENTELVLYYADENGDFLVPEKRTLPYSDQKNLPDTVLDLLASAPQSAGLRSALPAGARHLDVSVENGLCTVDFNEDFFTNRPADEQSELLAVLSVVNSLCELNGIDRVQLYVAGNEVPVYRYLDLSEPWIPDQAAVGPVRQELGEFPGALCLPDRSGLLHRMTIRARARGSASREAVLLLALFDRTERNGMTDLFSNVRTPVSIRTENGICTVELPKNTLPYEEPAREIAIRSITATLTTLPEVLSVALSEDGVPVSETPLVPEESWFCTRSLEE